MYAKQNRRAEREAWLAIGLGERAERAGEREQRAEQSRESRERPCFELA